MTNQKSSKSVRTTAGRRFDVVTASNGLSGLAAARREKPGPDRPRPDAARHGWLDVCRTLRREGDIPIIMLTARVEESDNSSAWNWARTDYITKPFSPRELAARVRVVLRRASGDPTSEIIPAPEM